MLRTQNFPYPLLTRYILFLPLGTPQKFSMDSQKTFKIVEHLRQQQREQQGHYYG